MTYRRIGTWLIVVLAASVVAAGGVSAHGPGHPATAGGDTAWMGSVMADHMGTWGADHMGTWGADWMGPTQQQYACPGLGAGMMGPSGGTMGASTWGMAGTGSGFGLGWLYPLLLLGVVIGLGYVVVSRTGEGGSGSALDVLRERYARGELTEEEFDARLDRLEA